MKSGVFLRALKDNGEVSDWSRELGYAGIMRCRGDMLRDCTRTVRVISTCWTLMAISIFCLGCFACVLFKKVLLSSFSPFLDSYVGAWSCERESAMREGCKWAKWPRNLSSSPVLPWRFRSLQSRRVCFSSPLAHVTEASVTRYK